MSNPAKPWEYYNEWTTRVVEEFSAQGDKERERGLPISMGFDKTKIKNEGDTARGQLGFIGFVVGPLYDAFSRVGPIDIADSAMANLSENKARWKAIGDEHPPS